LVFAWKLWRFSKSLSTFFSLKQRRLLFCTPFPAFRNWIAIPPSFFGRPAQFTCRFPFPLSSQPYSFSPPLYPLMIPSNTLNDCPFFPHFFLWYGPDRFLFSSSSNFFCFVSSVYLPDFKAARSSLVLSIIRVLFRYSLFEMGYFLRPIDQFFVGLLFI